MEGIVNVYYLVKRKQSEKALYILSQPCDIWESQKVKSLWFLGF